MSPPSNLFDGASSGATVRDLRRLNLIGESDAFRRALRLIEKIAACDATTLVHGETGTGKELAARAIHYLGTRADYPFIPVNCGAIPDTLIENELFGHRRGAFTDAREAQRGLVAQADGGTLFLDEVDALSPKGQVTLLRFLQDLHYRPVGGQREERADVRVIAATNVDLGALADKKVFRLDLLYRLNVLSVPVPALRARGGDAELLAEHFIRIYSTRYGRPAKPLHPDSLRWIRAYHWPGNVRELENLVHREYLLSDGPAIEIELALLGAPADEAGAPGAPEAPFDFNRAKARAIAQFEREFLARALSETGGNVSLAARRCGKERRSFGRLLKKHGIDKSEFLS
jgi:two-component system response regulator GlrR